MNILFICSGNISRSPLAACILRTMAAQDGKSDVVALSAGTHNLREEPYDEKMIDVAAKHGYLMQGHSQVMTDEMLLQADLILVMEQYHYVKVQKNLPYAQWHKLHLLNEYCFGEATGIDDPFYGSDALYEQVFEHIERCCRKIIENL